jgi:IS5 family transposase
MQRLCAEGVGPSVCQRTDLARLHRHFSASLQACGLKVCSGTIVDATIIAAPSLTKNKGGERDPEMHQVKKGSQWHFGMKAHIGTDSRNKLIHSVVATPADVHDSPGTGRTPAWPRNTGMG